ncbi:hypothetical protein AOLI_G00074920 [Acnodon oligacanthus]
MINSIFIREIYLFYTCIFGKCRKWKQRHLQAHEGTDQPAALFNPDAVRQEVSMGSRVSSGKMSAASRVVQVVRPHTPLIKFPNRQGIPRPNVQEALKLLGVSIPQSFPPAPALAPSATPAPRPTGTVSRLPGKPDNIAVVKELPQRYRRRAIALEEMDYIQRGGPE